jgi:23S rRNA (uracil1939-C5)-methyltransferase
MMRPGERLTLRLEKAVAGGRMLARHDGAIVLVAAGIPGETVEAEVEKTQRSTIWATTRRVLEASPDRVEPFCDGACGGNVYAHVAYTRQLDLKREILRDAFARLAHMPLPEALPVTPSPPEGYRMRARLHVRSGRLGFFREGTHELCDAGATRQLLPETIEAVRRLEAAIAAAPRGAISEVAIAENCAATERASHLELGANADPSRLAHITQVDGFTGVTCGAPQHARALTLWGSATVSDTIRGVSLRRQARAFFQGNRYLLEALVSRVVQQVPTGQIVDLYAGVGLFSTALAARGDTQVTAVEGDQVAAADLKHNAAGFGGALVARRQSVEGFLSSRRPTRPLDCVVVDPPRTGMTRDALQGLSALGVARVVYVSCDVATLARDSRTLADRGYRLTSLEAFDMFPNTAHVESIAIVDKVN